MSEAPTPKPQASSLLPHGREKVVAKRPDEGGCPQHEAPASTPAPLPAPRPLTRAQARDLSPSRERGEANGAARPIRTAPRALWLVAQSFLNTLYVLFGDPAAIAFQHTLTQEPYQLLASWIRCGEAMMRRLLLIEAAAYPKPNTPPRLWPKRTRVRRLVGFDDDKP